MTIKNDVYWTAVADFIKASGVAPSSVIAPSNFAELVPGIVAYERRNDAALADMIVLHKGMLETLGADWIEDRIDDLDPAFANEVFVVYSAKGAMVEADANPHVSAFRDILSKIGNEALPAPSGLREDAGSASFKAFAPATQVPTAPQPPLASNRLALFDPRELPAIGRQESEERIRALCRSHYMGGHEILCRVLGKYTMFLDTRDAGLSPHLLMDGFWEFWTTQFMIEVAKPGMTVVDVGANFGYYSVLLADLAGPSGRLVAVEPNPAVAKKLRKSLAINGFTSRSALAEVALSKEPRGELYFYIPDDEPKNARIVPDASPIAGGSSIRVRTTNLDKLLEKEKRVDFIKIDAEGAEAMILQGMTEIIAKHKPALLIEINAARGYDAPALLKWLQGLYAEVGYLDFDARIKPVTEDDLRTKNVGEDWMLYCA